MAFLIFAGPREVKFFGDLNDSEASLISSKLGQNAEALLRKELGNNNKSTKDLILQSKNYLIRKYTDLVPSSDRERAIKALREALPTFKGVTGEWLQPGVISYDLRLLASRRLRDVVKSRLKAILYYGTYLLNFTGWKKSLSPAEISPLENKDTG